MGHIAEISRLIQFDSKCAQTFLYGEEVPFLAIDEHSIMIPQEKLTHMIGGLTLRLRGANAVSVPLQPSVRPLVSPTAPVGPPPLPTAPGGVQDEPTNSSTAAVSK